MDGHGAALETILTNSAVPFPDRQDAHVLGWARCNHRGKTRRNYRRSCNGKFGLALIR
jgi:hypothetical protein